MQTIDWNWFFSSIAQSAAAIVGIFGAFIISKVLSNQTTFAQKSDRLLELLAESRRIADDAADRYFPWYNRYTDERALETVEEFLDDADSDAASMFEDYVLDENSSALSEYLYDQVGTFSPFTSQEEALSKIAKVLRDRRDKEIDRRQELQQRLDAAKAKAQSRLGTSSFPRITGIGLGENTIGVAMPVIPRIGKIPNPALTHNLNDERESIDAVVRAARHQVRLVSDFLKSIRGNPESSPEITQSLWLVMALFSVGVIYPLSLLPVRLDSRVHLSLGTVCQNLLSLQGLLLTLVFLIFLAIVTIFYRANRHLRYSLGDIDALKPFTDLATFSAYFRIMEENHRRAEEKRRAVEAPRSNA